MSVASTDALAVVRAIGGIGAEGGDLRARYLSPPDAKKNFVIACRVGDERFVLKVYRQSLRYTLQVLKNPLSRHFSRAFTIRSLAATRVRAELDGIAGFSLAGLRTFEVVARPRRTALLFRHEAGEPLRDVLLREDDTALSRRWVERVAGDLSRRQSLACERDDLRMIHPAPRLQHAWVLPGDELLYYDFEDRVNPALRVREAAAMELENFFFYLLRCPATADAGTIDVARGAVGADALERWTSHAERRRSALSGSARRRKDVLAAVLGG